VRVRVYIHIFVVKRFPGFATAAANHRRRREKISVSYSLQPGEKLRPRTPSPLPRLLYTAASPGERSRASGVRVHRCRLVRG